MSLLNFSLLGVCD